MPRPQCLKNRPQLPLRLAAGLLTTSLILTPGLALAGRTAFAGNQSLKLTDSFTPNRAGGHGTSLKRHIDYGSTVGGQRIGGGNKQLQLQLPDGARFNGQNAVQCPYASIGSAKYSDIPGICPKSSIIGSGTFSADARPALAQPVPGTITLYNVRGQHNDVLFLAHTQFGDFGFLFRYLTSDLNHDNDQDPVLQADFNDSGASSFNLKTIDFTLHGGTAKKPLLTTPLTCTRGGWLIGLKISSYGGPPPIQALDHIACTKG